MPLNIKPSSGSGSITLAATTGTSTNDTLTLPAKTGNIITSADSATVTAAMLASGAARSNFGAGAVLQVISATTTSNTSSSSTTFTAATGVTASITPASSSNKVLVIIASTIIPTGGTAAYATIYRNSSNLFGSAGQQTFYTASGGATWWPIALSYLDSPATTSATTYTLYFRPNGSTSTQVGDGGTSSIILMEIAA